MQKDQGNNCHRRWLYDFNYHNNERQATGPRMDPFGEPTSRRQNGRKNLHWYDWANMPLHEDWQVMVLASLAMQGMPQGQHLTFVQTLVLTSTQWICLKISTSREATNEARSLMQLSLVTPNFGYPKAILSATAQASKPSHAVCSHHSKPSHAVWSTWKLCSLKILDFGAKNILYSVKLVKIALYKMFFDLIQKFGLKKWVV